MGRPVTDDEDLLELPLGYEGDEADEAMGVPDADELTLAVIEDGPEDVGLDAEAGGSEVYEATLELDDADSMLDEGTLDELVAEVDAEGEEDGWTHESEGSNELWEEDWGDDDDSDDHDDGGLEGVDDPLLDAFADDDVDSELGDDDALAPDLGTDMLRDVAQDG